MTFRDVRKLTFWFMIGVGLGAVAAILYAPMTGKDARRLVTKTTRQAVETGREVYQTGRELFEKANEVVKAGVKAAEASA